MSISRCPTIFAAIVFVSVCSSCLCRAETLATNQAPFSGNSRSNELRQAVADLDGWLQQSAAGQSWRNVLMLPELSEALTHDSAQTRQAVDLTYGRLASGDPRLTNSRFGRVKWLLLSRIDAPNPRLTSQELIALCDLEEQHFQPPSIHQLEAAAVQVNESLARLRQRMPAVVGRLSTNERAKWDEFSGKLKDAGDKWNSRAHDLASGIWRSTLLEEEEVGGLRELADTMREFSARFFTGQAGMEAPEFKEAAYRIRDFVDLADVLYGPESTVAAEPPSLEAAGKIVREQYHNRLETIRKALRDSQPPFSHEVALQLQGPMQWLQACHQSAGLVRELRRHFTKPNYYGNVSSELVRRAMENDIYEDAPITDTILGTAICGTTHTTGRTMVELLPDANAASFLIRTSAVAASNTVGSHPPATIYSTGCTDLTGSKRLFMDEQGFHSGAVEAHASTHTNINGVGVSAKHFRRLVSRVAQKKVAESKPQAEAIASQHATERLRGRIEKQAGEQVAKANARYEEKIYRQLNRYNLYPQVLRYSSASTALMANGFEADNGRLSASDSPTQPQAHHDVLVQFHETAANNAIQTSFGGKTISQGQIRKRMILEGDTTGLKKLDEDDEKKDDEELSERAPRENLTDADVRQIKLERRQKRDLYRSVTFTRVNPVVMKFLDPDAESPLGAIRLLVHATRFSRYDLSNGQAAVNVPTEIAALYRLQNHDGICEAVRDGKLDIETLSEEASSADKKRVYALQSAFDRLLPKSIQIPKITPKDQLAKKLRPLPVTESRSQTGWMTVGWDIAK